MYKKTKQKGITLVSISYVNKYLYFHLSIFLEQVHIIYTVMKLYKKEIKNGKYENKIIKTQK